MKKLLFLLLIATACNTNTSTPLIVTEVHINDGTSYYKQKYRLLINNRTLVYTDKLYQVGDELK